ncbi:hypothetical protein [Amycolatopsis viridis]|uniref:Uncharacterized protein n=1 Tax=Amycolatopsis viridis TaxID=185678 RepID=A0ABX0SLS7_9PSEU|nr:hypothetical protein [Amycolatopsis viridis]NIH77888.1 hypothetical protein [Amycolatopsis viridis]
MTTGGSKAALVVGSEFMHDLGSLFPVAMTLAGDELVFTFVSPGEAQEWVAQRSGSVLAGREARFVVHPQEQQVLVELAGTRIRALIVLAEDGPAAPVHAPLPGRWRDQMPWTVRIALDELARMLARCQHHAGGPDPLIDLDLAYRPDPDYHERLDQAHEGVRPFIAPVRPTLSLRWRSATPGQRKAFLDELPDAPPGRGWLRRRRTVRVLGLEVEVAR